MNTRFFPVLLGLYCLLAASFTYAKVYKWVDDSGTVHFTDDAAKVPGHYWDRVEEKKIIKEKSPTAPEGRKWRNRRVQREPTDRFGRRQSWWRDRASKWWVQLEEATSQHQRITKEIEEARMVLEKARNDGKRRRYRRKIKRLQKEGEKYNGQIEQAKHMLNEVLLEEAKMADADPTWLRP